jgi:hypothetical protein
LTLLEDRGGRENEVTRTLRSYGRVNPVASGSPRVTSAGLASGQPPTPSASWGVVAVVSSAADDGTADPTCSQEGPAACACAQSTVARCQHEEEHPASHRATRDCTSARCGETPVAAAPREVPGRRALMPQLHRTMTYVLRQRHGGCVVHSAAAVHLRVTAAADVTAAQRTRNACCRFL